MGTSRSTRTLHVRNPNDEDSCVCNAAWVPSVGSRSGRCRNEGTMAGNVWELREMVAYIIVALLPSQDLRPAENPATSGALSDPPAAGDSPAND